MFGAAIGLPIGLLIAFLSGGAGSGGWAALGWVVPVALPIGYAAGGFVVGAISAWLYNVVALLVGGIEVELDSTGHR